VKSQWRSLGIATVCYILYLTISFKSRDTEFFVARVVEVFWERDKRGMTSRIVAKMEWKALNGVYFGSTIKNS
jgi:hypothetical protein